MNLNDNIDIFENLIQKRKDSEYEHRFQNLDMFEKNNEKIMRIMKPEIINLKILIMNYYLYIDCIVPNFIREKSKKKKT